jgi:hypothetical protein
MAETAVGKFTGFQIPQRSGRITRAVKNPIDKSTIVSVFPKRIIERKFTIEPGIFEIPAGRLENPGILVIGSSSWWKHFDENQPNLEIPVSSVSVADAVIRDYSIGMFGCDMENAIPGLFFVPGEVGVADIKTKYATKLKEVYDKQWNWFNFLVGAAESLWARSNGNPLVISDEMRLAAVELGKKDRPWLLDFNKIQLVSCVACGSLKNPAFPVCGVCRYVDQAHPMAKDLKFATG